MIKTFFIVLSFLGILGSTETSSSVFIRQCKDAPFFCRKISKMRPGLVLILLNIPRRWAHFRGGLIYGGCFRNFTEFLFIAEGQQVIIYHNHVFMSL